MTKFLDGILNRFSMYTVVSISLLILYVVTLIFSVLGEIPYSPLSFVVSTVVLLASVWLTSLLFGLLFRIKIHHESSLITGLILAFIFTPTLEPAGVTALAGVGALAGASKFLLAWKGRHIFNPVAAGAFIASLLGLAYATWWVATPPLFLFILIPTLLILYKTRRLLMGGVFVVVAGMLLIAMFLMGGLNLTESLTLLLSWPLLFFAGFMLSEPLTMAAKTRDQVIEAIIIAVLFAIPFQLGPIESTPILALLAGNLYAFVVSRRQSIQLTLKEVLELTPTSREFVFQPKRPLRFEAGQYLELTLPHAARDFRGIRRVFSITSAPGAEDVRVGVRFYEPPSTFKKALKALEPGAVIRGTNVNGDFVLPKDAKKPLLFIAGGIGITPFIGHLRWLQQQGEQRDVTLLYAVGSMKEVAYFDVLKASGINVVIVTEDETPAPVASWAVAKSFAVTSAILRDHVPDLTDRQAYLSGPPGLINGVKPLLLGARVKKIKTDYFTGY